MGVFVAQVCFLLKICCGLKVKCVSSLYAAGKTDLQAVKLKLHEYVGCIAKRSTAVACRGGLKN